MRKFGNSKKQKYLDSIPEYELRSPACNLSERCKFNFSYIDFEQEPSTSFNDWDAGNLVRFLNKLKELSRCSLKYWKTQRYGQGSVLSVYGSFPKKSDFIHPKHVPLDVLWARFRFEGDLRLVGFVVPDGFDGQLDEPSNQRFCRNTFYAVFLDEEHNFYK